MNRGAVVFLALAVLLAHTLAIHQNPDGEFAAPYEIAHVAYRLGRNLVYDGTPSWNPGGPPVESYPSVTWIGLAAIAARLYVSPTVVAQGFGLACALVSIVVLAQFSPKRTAGLIAPLLLAASGTTAAAAASGTETPLAMLLTTASFLAFERGAVRWLAVVLSLLLLTRPEGLAVLLVLLVFESRARPRTPNSWRPAGWWGFAPPVFLVLVSCVARRVITGTWVSPFASPLLERDPERWLLGLHYSWSFVYASGFGLLLLVLLSSILAGRSSAMGLRALAVAAAWMGIVALSGGDGLPFWNAFAPVLPLVFLAAQEALREWIDERANLAPAVLSLLLLTLTASLLASKVPGNIGPLELEDALTRLQQPTARLKSAFHRPLARLGLLDEIRSVEHLRPLGIFLRDRVQADASILTFWPGAIGYLSRREVYDLLGRAWPLPGMDRPHSWRGIQRVDPIQALSWSADYIVPAVGTLPESSEPRDFLNSWLEQFSASEDQARDLIVALRGYELVCVPVPAKSSDPSEPSEHPFPLLRRKDLDLAPSLTIELEEGSFLVLVQHEGHQQVVDLFVQLIDTSDNRWSLRPTGEWVSDLEVDARTSILIYPTGPRSIRMLQAALPEGVVGTRLSAWLHNPGMEPDAVLSPVGLAATVELLR